MSVRSFIKALALVAGLALTTAAVVPSTPAQAENTQKKQKFFFMLKEAPSNVNVSFMALGVAKMLAEKGHDVTLFLNIDAVRLVDKRQPLNLKFGMRDGTLEDVYNGLIKAGGKFIACPNCSKVAGLTKENLRPGAVFGNPKLVSTAILEADKIINY